MYGTGTRVREPKMCRFNLLDCKPIFILLYRPFDKKNLVKLTYMEKNLLDHCVSGCFTLPNIF